MRLSRKLILASAIWTNIAQGIYTKSMLEKGYGYADIETNYMSPSIFLPLSIAGIPGRYAVYAEHYIGKTDKNSRKPDYRLVSKKVF